MTDQKTDGTTAARSREPVATYAVGISPLVKERLRTIGIDKSIKQKIAAHLEKKVG